MEQLLDQYSRYGPRVEWSTLFVCLILAFVLCQVIAAVYSWTYHGLSYSREFVLALALAGVVSTLVMLAIGNSLTTGLGLMGALAFVRFRANLRDVRDLIFIFSSLAVGISVGVQAFAIAIAGTLSFCAFVLYITYVPFGVRRQYDGLLRFNCSVDAGVDDRLKRVLREHCAHFVLVSLREVAQGERLAQAYHVKLRDRSYDEHLVAALRGVDKLEDVSLVLQSSGQEA